MVLLLAHSCVQGGVEKESGERVNLGPGWRVEPGLNPVYESGTLAE